VSARCVAWRSSDGAVVARTGKFAAPSGTHATGGQTLNVDGQDGGALVIAPNEAAIFGFWRDPAASQVWSVTGAGTFVFLTDLSGDVGNFAGNAVCGGGFTCGDVQAWGELYGGDARALARSWPAFLRARRRC
jgi:hypothetical protein